MRDGRVTQSSPLLVAVGASTVGTPAAADFGYSPAVGDRVKVLVQDGDRFVLGKIRP